MGSKRFFFWNAPQRKFSRVKNHPGKYLWLSGPSGSTRAAHEGGQCNWKKL